MPVSVHKISLHGPAIINDSPVPIDQLSEEAQGARNKRGTGSIIFANATEI